MQTTKYRGVDPADPLETGSDSGTILTKGIGEILFQGVLGGLGFDIWEKETPRGTHHPDSRSLRCQVTPGKYSTLNPGNPLRPHRSPPVRGLLGRLSLTLTEPLEFEHISIEQTFGSHTVETRAEVGLLTRNIKIRGSVNADFTEEIEACDEDWHPGQFKVQSCFNGRFGEEIGGAQFGATVMLFGKEANKGLVQGRVEYVEVTEAGQALQLGRYPLHFHLVGNVSTSYIRGCAVHRTYNRAVTIHAADYLTVEKNVVYNNMGHAIFTEDGVEQFNVIQYNLAVYTRSSLSLLNVDVTPSSYWIVHPNNIVRHNAAAGGTHFGYWYRLERHPSGPSATNSICQNNAPIGEFSYNTVHSMGWYGLWVFSMDGYFPKDNGCRGRNVLARWDGLTTWRNERGAEIVFGGQLQFHNFVALDNEFSGIEMVQMEGGFGMDNGPGVFNSVIIGHSALTPEGCGDETSGIITRRRLSSHRRHRVLQIRYQQVHGAVRGLSVQSLPRALSSAGQRPHLLNFKWEHQRVWGSMQMVAVGAAETSLQTPCGEKSWIPPKPGYRFTGNTLGPNPQANVYGDLCEYTGCFAPTPPPVPTGRPDVTFLCSDVEPGKEFLWEEDIRGGKIWPPGERDGIIIPPGWCPPKEVFLQKPPFTPPKYRSYLNLQV
ncbi:fibrocystin-L-like [Penaeus monodon]|uniref:fibrocystin-L-like n=1 Tax=Penaeus monodon TaxID=6687 RepID=UPI0018A77B51|nr:fibrocystin-L-like [Penaeus monodon]